MNVQFLYVICNFCLGCCCSPNHSCLVFLVCFLYTVVTSSDIISYLLQYHFLPVTIIISYLLFFTDDFFILVITIGHDIVHNVRDSFTCIQCIGMLSLENEPMMWTFYHVCRTGTFSFTGKRRFFRINASTTSDMVKIHIKGK